jgi:outer membrane protein assembly factor BamB
MRSGSNVTLIGTITTLIVCFFAWCGVVAADTPSPEAFADPPVQSWPRPLWFWNNTEVTAETLRTQMQKSKQLSKYGGFGILPFGKSFGPDYLSEEYFALYGVALEQAKELGLTMSLYDEYGFPSGSAGAPNSRDVSLFAQKYPELTLKRLDKHEQTVTGPSAYETTVPSGRLMSAVAMNTVTLERVDLTDKVAERSLKWEVPAGTWIVMVFVCVTDGYPCCDYLDPDAADKFIAMTHQAYYDRFGDHFGTTIDSTFYDEPTLYRGEGRTWTDKFNEKFEQRYGFDARPYYPALWYDIGTKTQAARNYLFGFRSELYALGFPKRIQDWCDEHGIEATGHQDQEEIANPVSVAGDLMKCFEHQAIPGIDKIGGNRPAERVYKVVSSAAYNYDRTLVMSETYGAMGNLSWDSMYTVAMEQYTKGINMLIPHAVWYDDEHVTFKPELSYRSPIYAERLAEFNTYLARLNLMLQNDAQHVADIAVLYPIATLQGSHHLDGPLGHYKGGVEVPEADYLDVGELLIAGVGRDYTFIHPDVLDAKCAIEGSELVLKNEIQPGRFNVLVLPGHETIRWSNLHAIKAFSDAGGKVIATGRLPSKSAEFGHDADVVRTVEAMFGTDGAGIHLTSLDAATLRQALDQASAVHDVECEGDRVPRYIHKVKDGRHIYLFANIDGKGLDTYVRLRGRMDLGAWDPHTGKVQPAEYTHETEAGQSVTRLRLALPARKSLFIVGQESVRFDTQDTNEPSDDVPTIQPWRAVDLDPEYGGQWVVTGDVDGDGQVEVVSCENVNEGDVHYTSTAVAQKLDGSVLWRWGDPKPGRKIWHHDVACQIHDWDADGRNEVVLCTKGALVVLNGTTGQEIQRIPIAKDATDCLVFCRLSSTDGPCDVLVKDRYHRIWAYNTKGDLLWTVRDPGGYRTAHQPRPIDLDGDGRDEIMAGYAMLNSDGSVRWVFQSKAVDQKRGHLDCARVVRRRDSPDEFRIALTCCGAGNVALIDGNGALVWEASGHHYESIDIGQVLPNHPGPQIVVDIDHRPYGKSPLCVFDEEGYLLGRITTNYSRQHTLLDWDGDGCDEMIVAHTNGLYDHQGTRIATLATPGAERPNVKGTYEKSVLVGDMDGDRIADLTLATPDRVYVYRNLHGKKADGPVRLGSERNFTLY